MKNIFLSLSLLVFLTSQAPLYAQSDELNLTIGLMMPEGHSELDAGALDKFHSRLMRVFTNNGVSAEAVTNGLVAYPQIDVYAEERVQAGISTVFVQEIEVCLFIGQVDQKAIFSTQCKTLKGTGKDRNRAIQAAIRELDPNDQVWTSFVSTAKSEIRTYYEEQCSNLMAKAEQLRKTGKLEEAFANLYNIPSEVSCYAQASELTQSIYQQYKDEYCAQNLQQAKAQLAANNYSGALRTIGWIDPTAGCHAEAMQIMAAAADELDAETKKRWDFYAERVKKREELESLRIEAIRDIGVAYGQRNPVTNWNIIR